MSGIGPLPEQLSSFQTVVFWHQVIRLHIYFDGISKTKSTRGGQKLALHSIVDFVTVALVVVLNSVLTVGLVVALATAPIAVLVDIIMGFPRL